MHAYGFSEGGQFYVALYATVELVIVAAAWFRYGNAKTLSSDPVDEPDLGEA
jgi:hypothetical protein